MPSKMHIQPDRDRIAKIRSAINAAGGTVKMAAAIGYRTAERVRHFYAPGYPVPAERCRQFVAAAKGAIDLRTLRPDLYDGLTVAELGYRPR